MKELKLLSIVNLFFLLIIFAACTENLRNDDPASTITPGNNLAVDSVTAHANNTDSLTQLKNARKENSINDNAK